MSQSDKSAAFQELKAAGITFQKHYREYTTEELQAAVVKLREGLAAAKQAQEPEPAPINDGFGDEPAPASFFGFDEPMSHPQGPDPHPPPVAEVPPAPARPPVRERDPGELAGQRQNQGGTEVPIRTDEQGRVWYQEEVLKPAYPKPRGRRVLKYIDTGVQTKEVRAGDYVETFEIAGEEVGREQEVKVTLPSYQVGLFKDPRFPFKVWTYGGQEGFDLFEVQDFYGGPEMVPAEVKRKYVANVLCYDIRTVVRAIQAEYRQQQLTAGRAHA